MYRVEWLTPYEQEIVDPTGRGRATIASMQQGNPTPVPAFLRITDRDQWLSEYKSLQHKLRPHISSEVAEYDEEMVKKWGAQGARFALTEVQDCYARSYELADRTINADPFSMALDYFLRRLKEMVSFRGYPQNFYRSILHTAGALPTMAQKGTYFAETVGFKHYRHVLPMLPGQRNQRLKHRTINQDANANVRLFEEELNAIRFWLKTNFPEYFGAWLNPLRELVPAITRRIMGRRWFSVEADYKACDEHFSFDLVQELILPVYEILIPDSTVFHEFAAYIEELFYQPIFFGEYCWTGKHNLLSGQNITNDFETIFDVILRIAVSFHLGVRPESLVGGSLGDDQFLIVDSERDADKALDCTIALANSVGMEIERSKCRVSSRSVRFCRKTYAVALPHGVDHLGRDLIWGAYPCSLALNNIVNPERGNHTLSEAIKATIQRLDVTYGNQSFLPFVQFVGKRMNFAVTPEQAEMADVTDWWQRLYGEKWSLLDSHAYLALKASNLWR